MDNYIVSARKYRPVTFDSVVGQKALTTTLKNAILTQKLAHAYLFCGPRGVGKTTCARIFAKTINCMHLTPEGEACGKCESCRAFAEQRSFNIHELDAASNNSVDDIRQLVEQVRMPPQVGKYKVYIIDEVHMLSTAAFNAFLKTLEEPPQHAIFILATTEKHKILPTILSRCQVYDFNRIGVRDIAEHLASVAKQEEINAEPEALHMIAAKADGGMRDALSIFDQVVSYTGGDLTYAKVIENLNILDYDYYFKVTDACRLCRPGDALLLFDEVLGKGFDGGLFIDGLASHLRDVWMSKDPNTLRLLDVPIEVRTQYLNQAKLCSSNFLYKAITLCTECDMNYRTSRNRRLLVEVTLMKMAHINIDDGGDSGGRPIKTEASADGTYVITKGQTSRNRGPLVGGMIDEKIIPDEKKPIVTENQQATALSTKPANATVSAPERGHFSDRSKGIAGVRVVKRFLTFSLKDGPLIKKEEAKKKRLVELPKDKTLPVEDVPIDPSKLTYYWRDWAFCLPQEYVALQNRMIGIIPTLLDANGTFEVLVDNELAARDFVQIKSEVEEYLRLMLQNKGVRMTVRVTAPMERFKPVTRQEKFQVMAQLNPALNTLKEVFGLRFD